MEESKSLFVFGYGSLLWKPGFKHGKALVGSVRGFARRMWQGNETHRGTPGKPGRVATLVEDKKDETHGVAMELQGEEALDYLNQREMTLGGYSSQFTLFHPLPTEEGIAIAPFTVLVFVASPNSGPYWLGPASSTAIAEQVVSSEGPSGHNVEYLLRLAEWLHTAVPDAWDEHLFSIEMEVRRLVAERGLCLTTLMGEKVEELMVATSENLTVSPSAARRGTFTHTCEKKCLKCVKL
jgi:cation transport protein ChaC